MADLNFSLFNLSLPTLQALETAFTTALTQVAVAGQEYRIGEHHFTLADLPAITDTLAEIGAAIRFKSGGRITNVRGNFNRGYPIWPNPSASSGQGYPL